ncbi:multiubiquitin domain-containing protein [Reyranella soli]|uniref:Multi-ubiquitin domain-containing protein n=1 Tax=Reyranella soli TaxID=1230389 RepID=A0A512NJ88_9HYPH|nr:multiubiquitin domain-containing protein [Reyranella soli]GEP59006.1 hypothetical protein RSO01_61720 [Reyranella soli]
MHNENAKSGHPAGPVEKLLEEVEEIIEEVVDLEECARAGRKPPRAHRYRFKVNDKPYEWKEPTILGRQILEVAGLVPPTDYTLRQKMAHGEPRRIGLEDRVDLREPGIEKFRAIKRGQQEGEVQDRRGAPVLDQDRLFLETYGRRWEIIVDGSIWVLFHDFPLPPGYSQTHVLLAIRLESGYPMTALDMMYVYPAITRADGKPIPQVEVMQAIDGKQFQRWSRHRTAANPWVPGEDSLETHIYLVEDFFRAEFTR